MTLKERLIAGRERIQRGWAKHRMAENAHGMGVNPGSPEAVCWCAMGAIRDLPGDNCASLTYFDELVAAENCLAETSTKSPLSITTYNDYEVHTKENAVAWFDKAIELAP